MGFRKSGCFVAAWLGVGLWLLTAAGQAQEAPMITAVEAKEGPAAIQWTPAGQATAQPLTPGLMLAEGRAELGAAQRAMLLSSAGDVAIVALGPSRFETSAEGDAIVFTLLSGKIMFGWVGGADAAAGVKWAVRGADAREPVASGPIGRGWVYVTNTPEQADVAFVSGGSGGETLSVMVGGTTSTLRSGERLSIRGGSAQSAALEPWLKDSGFEMPNMAVRIGVASAQSQRTGLQNELFHRVVEWDRRAQAPSVRLHLEAQQFRPEIRTLAVTVTAQVPSATTQGGFNQVIKIAGANSVPPLSPAAIAVGGTSALENNANAERILTITSSRGLGFGGLSRLALSGVTAGGTPTAGPPGLTGR